MKPKVITFDLTPEEAKELRGALALVETYRRRAAKKMKVSPDSGLHSLEVRVIGTRAEVLIKPN